MRNLKLIYRYDGSDFYGFQRQPKKRTVQGEIEKILNLLLKEKIDLTSSGRTDKGVHALKQVSNFYTNSPIPVEKLKYALQRGLPKDIDLIEIKEVDKNFNARFDVKIRGYKYIISREKNPFKNRYETYLNKNLDTKKLIKILSPFVGVHNFNNFRLSDCGSANPIREIYSIEVSQIDEFRIQIDILGNAFLKSQIRIMIGTALAIYFNEQNENYILELLKNPEKKFTKKIASPFGLYLSQIIY